MTSCNCCFLLVILLFIALIALMNSRGVQGSLFCPHTAYPSADSDFEEIQVEVQAQDDPIQLGQPLYRLKRKGVESSQQLNLHQLDAATGNGNFRQIPGERPFRLFTTSHSAECPKRGCLHELALAEPRIPGTFFYHTDTIMGKLIPPGFLTVEATPCRLYCAIVRDDCGADVPIYRHFKMVGPRVFYAYSTSPEVEQQHIGANFTREQMPMCFGWSASSPREKLLAASTADLLEGKKHRSNEEKKVTKDKDQGKKQQLEKASSKHPHEEEAVVERLLNKVSVVESEEDEGKAGQSDAKEAAEIDECFVGNTIAAAGFGGGNASREDNIATSATITVEQQKIALDEPQLEVEEDGAEEESANADGGSFAVLTAYDNGKLGTLRDHLYTTRKNVPDEYKKEKVLGRVLLNPASSNCSNECLHKMGQTLANRSDGLGIFPMRDHKLVLMGKESADTYYAPTGEFFFCAKREGQCGARLALRRFWHLTEMDTLLTVNSTAAATVPVLAIPTWDRVLCYIWE